MKLKLPSAFVGIIFLIGPAMAQSVEVVPTLTYRSSDSYVRLGIRIKGSLHSSVMIQCIGYVDEHSGVPVSQGKKYLRATPYRETTDEVMMPIHGAVPGAYSCRIISN